MLHTAASSDFPGSLTCETGGRRWPLLWNPGRSGLLLLAVSQKEAYLKLESPTGEAEKAHRWLPGIGSRQPSARHAFNVQGHKGSTSHQHESKQS